MIVKVLGLSKFGECFERAAETIDLWETIPKLRAMARKLARDYLTKWPNVEFVAIRRDDDHRQIVKVRRAAPRERRAPRKR